MLISILETLMVPCMIILNQTKEKSKMEFTLI